MVHVHCGIGHILLIALLTVHLMNASAYRIEAAGSTSYDDYYSHALGEEEEPLLKATSPKAANSIAITTTHSGMKNNDGSGGSSGSSSSSSTPSEAALLTTMVTEFLANTAQTSNKDEDTESSAAIAMESHGTSEQPAATTTTTSSSTMAAPVAAAAAATQSTTSDEQVTNKRRIITYDQRQEGQYNVRADLENFMIVLIPPTTVSDSLLDLLRKQQQRQSTLTALKRSKLKHQHAAAIESDEGKYQHAIKIGQSAAAQNANYLLQRAQNYASAAAGSGYPLMPPLHALHTQFAEAATSGSGSGSGSGSSGIAAEGAVDKLGAPAEFIEGRTPYRVDISASDDEQLHLHLPERQREQQLLLAQQLHGHGGEQGQHVVDVLPPPYTPLAYQHLMKPYLDAEPTIALPPAELKRSGNHLTPASGNFLATYSRLLNAGLGGNEFGSKVGHRSNSLGSDNNGQRQGGFYRMARSILGYDFFKGNQLDARNNADSNRYFYPLYRSEHSLGAAQIYPPLDLPHVAESGTDAVNTEERHLNPIHIGAQGEEEEEDDIEAEADEIPHVDDLPLAGYDYDAMEVQAKKLLERCSPGQRRDSYGLCRKIHGY